MYTGEVSYYFVISLIKLKITELYHCIIENVHPAYGLLCIEIKYAYYIIFKFTKMYTLRQGYSV